MLANSGFGSMLPENIGNLSKPRKSDQFPAFWEAFASFYINVMISVMCTLRQKGGEKPILLNTPPLQSGFFT